MTQEDRRDLEKLLDKKLAGVATKEALTELEARMATKEDLAKLESGIRQVLQDGIIPQLDKLHTRMNDLSDAMERIERQLQAVVDRQDRQDEVLKRHEKRLRDHKQRLEILETAAT